MEDPIQYDKPKRKNGWLRQRPSVIIIEVLLVVVALVVTWRYLFPAAPAALPAVSTPIARDPESLYAEAVEAYKARDYALAIDLYTAALAAGYARPAWIYFERGRAYNAADNYEAAIADFTESIRLCESECHIDYQNRSFAYENLGRLAEALQDLNQSIEIKPDYALGFQDRSEIYTKLGQTGPALRDMNRALELRQPKLVRRGLTTSGGERSGELAAANEQVVFAFDGQAGARLTARAESAAFDVMLGLRDAAGTLIAFNDDRHSETRNAYIADFVLPEDGVYTLVVASYLDEEYGAFTIAAAITSLPLHSPASFVPITPANAARLDEYAQFAWSVAAATWAADGLTLYDTNSSGVTRYDTTTTPPTKQAVLPLTFYPNQLALAPNALSLAVAESDDVLLYSLVTRERTAVLRNQQMPITSLIYNADGSTILATAIDDVVYRWDTLTGQINARIVVDMATVEAAAYQPHSAIVAFGGSGGRVEFWNLETGAQVNVWLAPAVGEARVTALAYSPNGDQLAVGTSNGGMWLVDAAGTTTLTTYAGHLRAVNALAFSPDGRLLASASEDGSARLWSGSNAIALAILLGHREPVTTLAFREDGRVLATTGKDMTVRLWRVIE